VLVYAVVDTTLSPDFQLGDALEVYVRREDAERFIEEVRGDEPELAKDLRIEERRARSRRPSVEVAFAAGLVRLLEEGRFKVPVRLGEHVLNLRYHLAQCRDGVREPLLESP